MTKTGCAASTGVGRGVGVRGRLTRVRRRGQIELLPPVELDGAQPVRVELALSWSPRDPYTVRASFQAAGTQKVKWLLGRELLEQGLLFPAGQGDVFLCTNPWDEAAETVLLILEHEFRVGFRVPRRLLEGFLAAVDGVEGRFQPAVAGAGLGEGGDA